MQVGTFTAKRTTVPFLYNLEGSVDGLDVIDFPGVDDKDHTIPELAKLLLTLAQMVVFIVDYRYSVCSSTCISNNSLHIVISPNTLTVGKYLQILQRRGFNNWQMKTFQFSCASHMLTACTASA